MSVSPFKKEFLDMKYAYVDGENDAPHKQLKKKNRTKIKRSKHKHEYVNAIFYYPSTFLGKTQQFYYLGSYCSICGKIGDYHEDDYYQKERKKAMNEGRFLPEWMIRADSNQENWPFFQYYKQFPASPFKDKFIDLS